MRIGFNACRALGLALCAQAAAAWAQAPAAPAPPPVFWEKHGDAVVVAVVVGIVTALVLPLMRALVESLAKRLGDGFTATLQGLGARFRGRYLKAMTDRHGRLKLIGIYNRGDLHPPRLREVYVSLRLAAGQEDGPKLGWNEALGPEARRVVILGAPGAGKSTLLDYLVLVLTGEVRHSLRASLGKPLPLFARLRELGTEGKDDLLALLRISVPLKRVPSWVPERWLRKGRCVVLLDGLDEVLDEGRQKRAVEEIKRLVADFPDNRYVVTCRLAGWRNQLADLDFRTYEVQELDADGIRQFLAAWYREVLRAKDLQLLGARPRAEQLRNVEERARTEAGRRADDLWAALTKNENLLRLARTPLLLSLITLVHYHRKTDLPEGRAALYDDCLRILLDLWDREDKELQVPGPTLKEKLMVLKAIAFHFLEREILEADMPGLEPVITPLLPQVKATITAEDLVKGVVERSGVLVELALGRYGFAHRALHDALAADWIVEHERDGLLRANAGSERWREVILIAAGKAPAERARRLVEALLASDAEGSEEGAALQVAGLALAEDIQLGEDLREKVRRRLLDRLSEEERAGAFGRLAGALLTGAPEAAREWMEEVLRGDSDPVRRDRVFELLPDLGEEHGRALVPLLGRLLGDGQNDLQTREQAALALARMGISPEPGVWEALHLAREQGEERLKAAATWAWCELGRFESLGLVKVPAGEFLMGSKEKEGDDDETPQHALYLPTFYIGKHQVTAGEYRDLAVGKGVWLDEAWPAGNRQDDHPVTRVSWHDALAYAKARGMGLPSEAEWEKAARGTDGRRYPWGDEWIPGRANAQDQDRPSIGSPAALKRGGLLQGWARWPRRLGTTPVGRFSPQGDSPYGCAEMAGNVLEWTRSNDREYPYVPGDGREDLVPAFRRVLRGGAFFDGPRYGRCAVRLRCEPENRFGSVGFRVVVSPFRSDF